MAADRSPASSSDSEDIPRLRPTTTYPSARAYHHRHVDHRDDDSPKSPRDLQRKFRGTTARKSEELNRLRAHLTKMAGRTTQADAGTIPRSGCSSQEQVFVSVPSGDGVTLELLIPISSEQELLEQKQKNPPHSVTSYATPRHPKLQAPAQTMTEHLAELRDLEPWERPLRPKRGEPRSLWQQLLPRAFIDVVDTLEREHCVDVLPNHSPNPSPPLPTLQQVNCSPTCCSHTCWFVSCRRFCGWAGRLWTTSPPLAGSSLPLRGRGPSAVSPAFAWARPDPAAVLVWASAHASAEARVRPEEELERPPRRLCG